MNDEMLRAQFRADVAVMRELGVTKWNGIELGPDPATKPSDDDRTQPTPPDPDEVEQRARDARRAIGLRAGARLAPRLSENHR